MISVIIPLYNKQDAINSTIQSVLTQTFSNIEIIVVDDGSTDNSVDTVRKFDDKRIRLISKANGGVSSARNVGIREAKYDFIAFLDADDQWDTNYLETQVNLIKDFPEAKMWGVAWGTIDDGIRQKGYGVRIPDGFRGLVNNYDYFDKRMFLYFTDIVVIDKHVFTEIEMFDERIGCGEDLDLWWRMILHYPVAYQNTCLAYYRQDSENRITQSNPKLENHFIYFIEKYECYYDSHPEFKKYLQHEVLGHLYKYFLKDRTNNDVKRILSQIDFSLQPFSYRVRYFSPKLYSLINRK